MLFLPDSNVQQAPTAKRRLLHACMHHASLHNPACTLSLFLLSLLLRDNAVTQAEHWLLIQISHMILGTLTYAFSLSGTCVIKSSLQAA